MTEKCKAHPEQELVIIKFCPCCHQEFYGKHRNVSMGVAVEPLPQGALPIYDRDVDVISTVVGPLEGDGIEVEELDVEFEDIATILKDTE
jgi:hypothetical protein